MICISLQIKLNIWYVNDYYLDIYFLFTSDIRFPIRVNPSTWATFLAGDVVPKAMADSPEAMTFYNVMDYTPNALLFIIIILIGITKSKSILIIIIIIEFITPIITRIVTIIIIITN